MRLLWNVSVIDINEPPIVANVPLLLASSLRARSLTTGTEVIDIIVCILFNALLFLNLFLLLLVYVDVILHKIQLLVGISLFAQDIRNNTRFIIRIKLMKIIRCVRSTSSQNLRPIFIAFISRPCIFPSAINFGHGRFILSDVGRLYCEVLRLGHLGGID